ncbi:MAG: DnaJ domain-containing protein [Clostridia bacterium]|nr:DnaJ domain-containing protein [Clostridia bacterium]
MNPYEVLGVPEGADAATVKKAYYDLVKKYHPDKYKDNPLKDLAEEKLKEINKAYDMIQGGGASSSSYSSYSSSSSYSGGGSSSSSYGGSTHTAHYADVRQLIASNRLAEAESLLNTKDKTTAEYHYLAGIIALRRGYYDSALEHLDKAANMDPSNTEYQFARNNVRNRTASYQNYTPNTSYTGCSSPCDCCSTLLCADCCCECMGGDIIPCC